MGSQAIETTSLKDGNSLCEDENPFFLVHQVTGDVTTAHWVVQGVSFQRERTSIAFSPTHWLTGFKTVEDTRGTSRVVARAFVAAGLCVLWLFIGAMDKGLCDENNTRRLLSATEKEQGIAQINAMRDEPLLISLVVQTSAEQKEILEPGREKFELIRDRLTLAQRLDATQGKTAQALQPAPTAAGERKQLLERQQELDRAEALARALTSSLRGELDAMRSAAEAAEMK